MNRPQSPVLIRKPRSQNPKPLKSSQQRKNCGSGPKNSAESDEHFYDSDPGRARRAQAVAPRGARYEAGPSGSVSIEWDEQDYSAPRTDKLSYNPEGRAQSQNPMRAHSDPYDGVAVAPRSARYGAGGPGYHTAFAEGGRVKRPERGDTFDESSFDEIDVDVSTKNPRSEEERPRGVARGGFQGRGEADLSGRDEPYGTGPSAAEGARAPAKTYPSAIQYLLDVCTRDVNEIKEIFKGRSRQGYLKIFEAYKKNLLPRDYSIIQSGLIFIYKYSRIYSIDETYAKWMIGIFEIPNNHIASYTNKKTLESIAKSVGVSPIGKAEVLIDRIRTVIDPS